MRLIDLTGQKFGRLTVTGRAPNQGKHTMWYCDCECGTKQKIISQANLCNENHTRSCGCLKREKSAENGRKRKGLPNLKNKRYNTYDLSGEYGVGYTLKGEEFYFDLEDFDKIKDYCWWKNDNGYLITSLRNNKKVRMHRLIMDEQDTNVRIDHKDHNTVNNRKYNLRRATNAENTRNGKLRSTNTSGVTGVRYNDQKGKWTAEITVDYKNIYLGAYDTFEDALKVRKEAEDRYFGEFSYNNSMKAVNK